MNKKTGRTKAFYLDIGRRVLELSEVNPTLSYSALARHCSVSEGFVNKVFKSRHLYASVPALNADVTPEKQEPAAVPQRDPLAVVDLIRKYCQKEILWCEDVEASSIATGKAAAISRMQALNDVLAIADGRDT